MLCFLLLSILSSQIIESVLAFTNSCIKALSSQILRYHIHKKFVSKLWQGRMQICMKGEVRFFSFLLHNSLNINFFNNSLINNEFYKKKIFIIVRCKNRNMIHCQKEIKQILT